MCGLMGVISTEKLKDKKGVFAQLMALSVSRGRDSSGLLGIERNEKKGPLYLIKKEALHVFDFLRDKSIQNTLSDPSLNSLLGHVRAATIGKVEKETAHPYLFGNIIGFHNGTIRGYKKDEDLTDSARFYSRVNSEGFESALKELPFDSAYCFVFWDGSNDTYHFFRNKKRELYFSLSADKKTLIYASEARFIRAALQMFDIEDFGSPYLIDTNTLVHVKNDGTELSFDVKKDYLEKDVIERHEKVFESRVYSYGYGSSTSHTPGTSGQRSYSSWEEKWNEDNQVHGSRSGNVRRIDTARARRSSGSSIDYPDISFSYDPSADVVCRTIRSGPSTMKKTYFYRSNPQFKEMYALAKKQMIMSCGGLWIELDESTYDFHVLTPKGKEKIIKSTDDRWGGWFHVFDTIENIWEGQAVEDAKAGLCDFVVPSDCVMTWNQMHSMASKNSSANYAPSDSEDPDKESPEGSVESEREVFDDAIPFDVDGPSYLLFGEQVEISEAAVRLETGCMNCIEKSTVNDTVFWMGPKDYVCQPCAGLSIVQNHVNLNNARQGRLIMPIFEAREVLN